MAENNNLDYSELQEKLNNLATTSLETAKNSIKAVSNTLVDLGKKAVEAGVSFESKMSSVQAKSQATAEDMTLLSEKAKEMGMKTKLSASEAADAFIDMANDGLKTEDMLKAIDGVASDMEKSMGDNLSGSLARLNSLLEILGITAYEKFKGPLKAAVDIAIEVIEALVTSLSDGKLGGSVDKLAEGFGYLIDNIADGVKEWLPKVIDFLAWIIENGSVIIAIIAGIAVAIKTIAIINAIIGAIAAIKNFIALIQGVGGVLATLQAGIALLGGPITVVVALIAGLIAGIVVLWNTNEGFREAVIGAWNSILEAGQVVWQWLINFFTVDIPNAWNTMIEWFAGIGPWFVGLWETIKQSFVDGWQAIVDFFTETIPAWIQSIGEWFNQLPYMIGFALGLVIGEFIKLGIAIFTWITTDLPQYIASIISWFSQLPGAIAQWFTQVITNIVNWGISLYNNINQAVANTINNVVNWFAQLPGRIQTWLVTTINNIILWCSNVYTTCSAWIGSTINGIINFFNSLPGRIWGCLASAISSISQWASSMYTTASNAASNTVSSIVNWFSSLPSKMLSIGTNIVQGIWNGILNAKSWLMDKVRSFANGIVDGIKSALGIHSPSRVFRDEVGVYLAQGIGVGFEDESSNIEQDMERSLFDLTAKMQATVDYETAKTPASVVGQSNYIVRGSEGNNEGGEIAEGSIFVLKNELDGKVIGESVYKVVNGKLALASKRVR